MNNFSRIVFIAMLLALPTGCAKNPRKDASHIINMAKEAKTTEEVLAFVDDQGYKECEPNLGNGYPSIVEAEKNLAIAEKSILVLGQDSPMYKMVKDSANSMETLMINSIETFLTNSCK
jgi:hypothetical protein